MSSLGGMEVTGIRSFNPEKAQAIKFSSPVTLIVGQNGSGKTTLIECLRYVTTGEVPSFSSTGGYTKNTNFVHDLNISDLNSCKAQVKLQFFDVNHERIVAIRSMAASRRSVAGQKKMEAKHLDSVVRKHSERTNEVTSMTAKCADMNREMASLLGVSDAILNSVIFCHQEDANWPLSEPKALKCRFDEIFNSAKYMKVVDAMKHTEKDLRATVNECKKEAIHLKLFKEHAEACRKQIKEREAILRQDTEDITRLKNEIEPLDARMKEIGRHRAETDRLRSTIASLKSEKATEEKNMNELKNNITDFYYGDIEDLKHDIEQFENDQRRNQKQIDARKDEIDELDRKTSQLNRQKGELLMKKGKLEAEINSNKEQTEKRDKQISEYATQLGFSGFSKSPFPEGKVAEFNDAMQSKIRRTNDDMDAQKSEFDSRIREAKSQSEKASNAVAANEQAIGMKEDLLRRTDKEISEIGAFLSDMDSKKAKLEKLENQIDTLEKELENAEREIDEDSLKSDIAKLQADRNATDSKIRLLQEESIKAAKEQKRRLEFEMLQKEKASKADTLQKLLDKHREALKEHFRGVDTSRLRDAVEDDLANRSKQLREANKELNEKKLAQKSKEKERDMRNVDLKAKEQELRDAEQKIERVSDGDDVESELEKLRENLDKLQFEKGTADGSESVYKSYIKYLENRPCCPLCERNFDSQKEATNLSDKLKREIKSLPAKASDLRNKIEKQQKRQTDLLQLQPVVDSAKVLKTKDIPALKAHVDKLTAEIRALKRDIETIDGSVTLQMEEEQIVKTIQADVGQIDSVHREIQELDVRIAAEKDHLGSDVNARSVETIQQEVAVLQMDLDDCSEALETKQDQLNAYREKVQSLRQQINKFTKDRLEITDTMQQRIAYQDKHSTLTKQRDQCRHDLDDLRRQTQPLKRALDECRSKERKVEAERESASQEFHNQLRKLEMYNRNISELNEWIRKFQHSGKTDQFDECDRKIRGVESDIVEFSRQRATLVDENGEQERALARSKVKFRDMEDSLKVKEKEQHIRELSAKIGRQTDEFERLGGLDMAGGDYDELVARHARLIQQLHQIEGRMKLSEQFLAEKREQSNSSGYKDADANYTKKLIQQVTTETAANDLVKYYKALDGAVIQYHSSKMEEINSKLRELWQKIYKNNDIDFIAIRSDTEIADKRRAYNYRVVMHSGGTELDMRGRCSAGQKVLACILIRIALAEVFSASCGVLALDEPTTNLDEANIRGLAEAMVEIIEEKSQQKNFQLILITHDENFLRLLLRGYGGDRLDTHFRITKDDSGYTQILEKKNTELME